ncbi:enolase C-terminal domain-like protein [Paraburkholderia youngii]|uniref:enolase C-terminal domain-like protein n=1 Tax=Paraburkholderia youngii TaxID=2782701 RepID=UPI003D251DB8
MLNQEFGTTYFEGKLSTRDPITSLRGLELMRERLGDSVMLRVDSNQAYSLPTAIKVGRQLQELDVTCWEVPVTTAEDMALLRRHCSIPFSAHNTEPTWAWAVSVSPARLSRHLQPPLIFESGGCRDSSQPSVRLRRYTSSPHLA